MSENKSKQQKINDVVAGDSKIPTPHALSSELIVEFLSLNNDCGPKSVCVSTKSISEAAKLLLSLHSEYEHIEFKNVAIGASYSESSATIFEKVSTIAFYDCDLSSIYDDVVQHCSQIKNLAVYTTDPSNQNPKYFQLNPIQRYAILERFQGCFGPRCDNRLAQFLQLNSQIKSLTCCIFGNEIKIKLRSINIECLALEELFLSFDDCSAHANFEVISAELKPLLERNSFKRIELEVNTKKLLKEKKLSLMKKLTGLHFDVECVPQTLFSTINSLVGLKTLHVSLSNSDNLPCFKFVDDWADNLVNLEEFILESDFDSDLDKSIYDVSVWITPFIRSAAKIKTMKILANDLRDAWYQIQEWNSIRKNLANATKVVILFDERLFRAFNETINFLHADAGMNGNLVHVQSVTVVRNIINIQEPFARFDLK